MPFDPDRFLAAQAAVYEDVLRELRAGRKSSHWMWFVFPQLAGLGRSETARFYALGSLDDARSYAAHPVLGARLRECTALVNAHAGTPIARILGEVDAMKFRSSMTLFSRAAEPDSCFHQALRVFHGGAADALTEQLLRTT